MDFQGIHAKWRMNALNHVFGGLNQPVPLFFGENCFDVVRQLVERLSPTAACT
jgi:hypothetical protein